MLVDVWQTLPTSFEIRFSHFCVPDTYKTLCIEELNMLNFKLKSNDSFLIEQGIENLLLKYNSLLKEIIEMKFLRRQFILTKFKSFSFGSIFYFFQLLFLLDRHIFLLVYDLKAFLETSRWNSIEIFIFSTTI